MIDLSPKTNPSRHPAMLFAQHRANREFRPMAVYVGPPGSGLFVQAPSDFHNVWFVRPVDDPAPKGAELFAIVNLTIPIVFQ